MGRCGNVKNGRVFGILWRLWGRKCGGRGWWGIDGLQKAIK